MKRDPKVGDLYPVWWDTEDGLPGGQHKARIIEILPYTGPFKFIKCIYRLHAPRTKKGWLDMSIEYGPGTPQWSERLNEIAGTLR